MTQILCKSKFSTIILLFFVIASVYLFNGYLSKNRQVLAFDDGNTSITYTIVTENGEYLMEKSGVEQGDSFVTSDKKMYEIFAINVEDRIAYARYLVTITLPEISISSAPTQVDQKTKNIGLYMTHNDESYLTGDGYDSVYGKGGIHDIAKLLQSSLNQLGINVYLYENLHIPHDTMAYSRSRVTAKQALADHELNALFDIHRDGASRSTYVTTDQGVEKCQVRIVVGKANPNYAIQTEFATYLLTVAEELYPWLFLDIYFAEGHYNQDLFSKSLLFEMGSHLVEKSLVQKTVPALANLINTALFYTAVEEETGDLVVGGNLTDGNTIDEVLSTYDTNTIEETATIGLIIVGGLLVVTVVVGSIVASKVGKKKYLS